MLIPHQYMPHTRKYRTALSEEVYYSRKKLVRRKENLAGKRDCWRGFITECDTPERKNHTYLHAMQRG